MFVCVIMTTNFLELAPTLKYLGAKWIPEKKVNFTPCQIRVIARLEPEIYTKMLKNLIEKLRAKFPATIPGCSILKFAHLDE